MNKTLVAFSKYLGHPIGGAEASTIELLNDRSDQFQNVELVFSSFPNSSKLSPTNIPHPKNWNRIELSEVYSFSRMNYFEYFLNFKKVRDYFRKNYNHQDELHTYGFLAIPAIEGFIGTSYYYVRSEPDLGFNPNYHVGSKRALKIAKNLIEAPFYILYRKHMERALKKTNVIANSEFMAKLCKERFDIKPRVMYPKINVENIKQSMLKYRDKELPKGITFIGDDYNKGLPIVRELSQNMPNELFIIFSRKITTPYQEKNVLWHPRTSDLGYVYSKSKMVIVPSFCREAYGRVAREAYLLGLPVLVSNNGGLPETVEYEQDKIINDYKNPDAWLSEVRRILN
ncbi:glycosyltransferase [Halomonadaceae bacterium KBTZ08]